MAITNDLLQEKLKGLTAQRDQLIAQTNQVVGAVIMVEQLIKEDLEKQAVEQALQDTPSL